MKKYLILVLLLVGCSKDNSPTAPSAPVTAPVIINPNNNQPATIEQLRSIYVQAHLRCNLKTNRDFEGGADFQIIDLLEPNTSPLSIELSEGHHYSRINFRLLINHINFRNNYIYTNQGPTNNIEIVVKGTTVSTIYPLNMHKRSTITLVPNKRIYLNYDHYDLYGEYVNTKVNCILKTIPRHTLR